LREKRERGDRSGPTLTCSRRLQARSKDDNERAARWAASLQQDSSCVCAGTKSVGCRGVEVGALGRCTLLELLQRPGIDGDVEAHSVPSAGRPALSVFASSRRRSSSFAVDLFVVLHPYIMLL
jgi:hypothetical protein